MTRPFYLLIFLAVVITGFVFFKVNYGPVTETVANLPWQIDVLPGGRSKVFGLTLGESTLGDARKQLGDDMEVAIIVAAGQTEGGLEMFYRHYKAGMFPGKLVLSADLASASVAQLMRQAFRVRYMESGARKYILNPGDLPKVFQAPLAAMTFIPAIDIDEAAVVRRFGPAAEIIRGKDQLRHLLYPDRGLDFIINEKGSEVLQYVAPRDFNRLREPLITGTREAD